MPDCAPTISAPTRTSRAYVPPSRTPVEIMGNDDGRTTFASIVRLLHPERSRSLHERRVDLWRPAIVFSMIGQMAAQTTIATCARKPSRG